MTDAKIVELLSRAVDDELDGAEIERLSKLLDAKPGLRDELESMRELRNAVSALANTMNAPEELDSVMEPMLRSAPAPVPTVRPAIRWLGIAAAIVVGVTVSVEMIRRNPQPAPVARAPVTADDQKIFELAPLPSAVPGEARPIGATDHLVERQPSPPSIPEPEALVVVGPLDAATEADTDRKAEVPAEPAAGREGESSGQIDARASGKRTKGHDDRERLPSSAALEGAASSPVVTAAKRQSAPPAVAGASVEAIRSATASVRIGGRQIWAGPAAGCPAGRYEIILEVDAGVVRHVVVTETDGGHPAECLLEGLEHAAVADVSDGAIAGVLIVE